MKAYLTIIGSIAIATTLGFAQEEPAESKKPGKPGKPRPNPEAIFKKLYADNSGAVSLDEFKAGPRAKENPEKAEEIFKKIDKDGNNEISLEEFKNHRPPHKPGHGGPRKPRGEGAPPAQ